MQYRVTWTIDIDAESAIDAAKLALDIHRDTESIATVFSVRDENGKETAIDLSS
jgi:hypothetical protein